MRWIDRIRTTAGATLALSLIPFGYAEAQEAPTQEMIDQGRSVFVGPGNCTLCHGQDAQGGTLGPDLTDGAWIWFESEDPNLWQELTDLIRDGIEAPAEFLSPMPARGGANLTDEQVRAVAAYVLSLNE